MLTHLNRKLENNQHAIKKSKLFTQAALSNTLMFVTRKQKRELTSNSCPSLPNIDHFSKLFQSFAIILNITATEVSATF